MQSVLDIYVLVLCFILLIVCLLGSLTGNSLIGLTVYKCKSLRTSFNALVMSLAICDMITTLFCVPLAAAGIYLDTIPDGICRLFEFIRSTCMVVQLITVVCIGVERYQAIHKPFDKLIRLKRVKVGILLSWSLGVICGILSVSAFYIEAILPACFLPLAHHAYLYGLYIMVPLGFICLVCTITLYIMITMLVVRHVNVTKKAKKNKVHPASDQRPESSAIVVNNLLLTKTYDSPPTTATNGLAHSTDAKKEIHLTTNNSKLSVPEPIAESPKDSSPSDQKASNTGSSAEKVNGNLSATVSGSTNNETLKKQPEAVQKQTISEETTKMPVNNERKNSNDAKIKKSSIDEKTISPNKKVEPEAKGTFKPEIQITPVEKNESVQIFGTNGINKSSDSKTASNSTQLKPEPQNSGDKKTPTVRVVEVCNMDGTVSKKQTNNTEIAGSICVMSNSNREKGKQRVEARTTKRTALVVVSFFVCWLPFPVAVLLTRLSVTIQPLMSLKVLAVVQCLSLLTTFLNPLAYLSLNAQFRNECKRVTKKLLHLDKKK